jgi:hypothetical protein
MGLRNKNELRKLIKGEDIVKYIKSQTINWWGLHNRMEDTKQVKKITNCYPIGVRTKEQNRWRKQHNLII